MGQPESWRRWRVPRSRRRTSRERSLQYQDLTPNARSRSPLPRLFRLKDTAGSCPGRKPAQKLDEGKEEEP